MSQFDRYNYFLQRSLANTPAPLPFGQATAQEAEDDGQGFWGDLVDSVQRGFQQGLGGDAESAYQLTGSTLAGDVAYSLNSAADGQLQQMSARGQEALNKEIIHEDQDGNLHIGDGFTDWQTWALQTGTLLGQIGTIAAGGGVTAIGVKGGTKLGARALGQEAAEKVAARAAALGISQQNAMRLGITAGTTAMASGMRAEQGRQEVLQMPLEQLAQNGNFKAVLSQLAEMPDYAGADQETLYTKARNVLAERVAADAFRDPVAIATDVASGAFGGVLGGWMGGVMPQLGKSAAGRFAQGALVEGGTEAIQGGATQRAVNLAVGANADASRGEWDKVLSTGLTEGLLAGPLGGFGGLLHKPRPPADTGNPTLDREIDDTERSLAEMFNVTPTGGTATLGGSQRIGDFKSRGASGAIALDGLEGEWLGPDDQDGGGLMADNWQLRNDPRLPAPDAPRLTGPSPALPRLTGPSTAEPDTWDYDEERDGWAAEAWEARESPEARNANAEDFDTWLRNVAEQMMTDDAAETDAREAPAPALPRWTDRAAASFAKAAGQMPTPLANEVKAAVGAFIASTPDATIEQVKNVAVQAVRENTPPTKERQQALTAVRSSLSPLAINVDEEAAGADLQGDDVDGDWVDFRSDAGGIDIPRADMPQIKSEHRGALVGYLRARGVEHSEESIPAADLKPTQSEFSRSKVAKAKGFTGGNRAILVSEDGHVLDGHHQWLAARDKGESVRAIRLGAPIVELVKMAHDFPSSFKESATERPQSKPSQEPEAAPALGDPAEATTVTAVQSRNLIEHTTGKGKTLRGVVRADLTKDEAKAVDPYTFQKDGGWFIRDREMGKLPPVKAQPQTTGAAAQAPELTTKTTGAVTTEQRPAPDRTAERRKLAVAELRVSASKITAAAQAEQNRDRLTNTAKRASQAAGSLEKARKDEAMGKTLANLADAIEGGRVTALAGVTNRLQVEQLQGIRRQAIPNEYFRHGFDGYRSAYNEVDNIPFSEIAQNVQYPAVTVWSEHLMSAARALEATSGKGSKANKDLAYTLRILARGDDNSDSQKIVLPDGVAGQLAALGDKNPHNSPLYGVNRAAELAKDGLARVNRLKRAGISDRQQLIEALRELEALGERAAPEPRLKQLERELIGKKIPGYHNTTGQALAIVLEQANIQPGDSVLEPSAGKGDMADAAKEAGANVDVIEINGNLRGILEEKGHNVVANDFMSFETDKRYDVVLMNPPFENGQDMAHTRKAFELVKPGGRLVSILGAGVTFNSSKAHQEFRAWVDEMGGSLERLPDGSFKGSDQSTGTNAVYLVLDKPEAAGEVTAPVVTDKYAEIDRREQRNIAAFNQLKDRLKVGAKVEYEGSNSDWVSGSVIDAGAPLSEIGVIRVSTPSGGAVSVGAADVMLVDNGTRDDTSAKAAPAVKESLTAERADEAVDASTQEVPTESPTEKLAGDSSKTATRLYSRSRNPEAFIEAPGGGIDFGEISPEVAEVIGRQPGKIRLQQGEQRADGTGYGLAHIEAKHGKQIRSAGFDSVEQFIASAASSYGQVWRANAGQLLVSVRDGRHDVMFIQLEPSEAGDFYRVNSAFPVRQDGYESKRGMVKLWDENEPASTTPGEQPTFAAEKSEVASRPSPNVRGQSNESIAAAQESSKAKLTGRQPGAKLALSDQMLADLREKYGSVENWWRDRFGFGFDALTESEARYILKSGLSPDGLRSRVAPAGNEAGSGLPESAPRFSLKGVKAPNNNPADGGVSFSRSPGISFSDYGVRPPGGTVRGIPRPQAEALIAQFLKEYKGAAGVQVNIAERQGAVSGLPSKSKEVVRAFYEGGEVTVVLENISSSAELKNILRHEILAHHGLRAIVNDSDYRTIVNAVLNSEKDKGPLAEVWRKVRANYDGDNEIQLAEEVIAHVAENTDQTGLGLYWERVVGLITRALRNVGLLPQGEISRTEIRELIRSIGEGMKQGVGRDIDADSGAMFSKSRLSEALDAASEVKAETIKDWIAGKWDDFTPAALGALTLRHLADIGRRVLPSISDYLDTVHQMGAKRNQMAERAAAFVEGVNGWAMKNKAAANALFDLMHETTVAGVDPSQPFARLDMGQANQAMKRYREQLQKATTADGRKRVQEKIRNLDQMMAAEAGRDGEYRKLKAKWDRLTPEAKAHYEQIRDTYRQQFEEMHDTLRQRIEQSVMDGAMRRAILDDMHDTMMWAQVQAPYFPLSRFGEYWIEAKDANGDRVFEMFDSASEQKARARQMGKEGLTVVDTGRKIDKIPGLSGASSGFVNDVMQALEGSGIGDQQRDALTDQIYQLYLRALPDRSLRKAFIHRRKTKGYSADAVRALASNTVRHAYQVSRLEYQPTLDALVQSVVDEAKTKGNQAAAIANELQKRHQWVMNPTNSKAANVLTSVGFVWMLGISPAAALVNLTQNAVVALPILASKFGWGPATRELGRSMKQFLVEGRHLMHGDWKGWSIERTLSGDELAAYRQLHEAGVIDKTNAHDLMGIADGDTSQYSDRWHKTMTFVSALFHKAEVANRETTAMAAYRLARQQGMGHDAAVKYAGNAVWDGHFDYSNQNRARYMQKDWQKVVLQFKQYGLNMMYYLWRNAFLATKGADAETKRMARTQLLGTLGMTAILGGAMALPSGIGVAGAIGAAYGYNRKLGHFLTLGTVLTIATAAAKAWGDDDEPWDAETEFRQWVLTVAGEDLGRVLLGGVVPGIDMAARIGLGNLMIREPDRDLESDNLWAHYAQQAMGPVLGGVVLNWLRAGSTIADGNIYRGFEQASPKFIKDFMKASRYGTEGALTMKGDEILGPDGFNVLDLFAQASGFTPSAMADKYDRRSAMKNYEQHILNRRTELMTAYYMAWQEKDSKKMVEIMDEIRGFNDSWPQLRITRRTLNQSRRARERASRNMVDGVPINKSLRGVLEDQFGE